MKKIHLLIFLLLTAFSFGTLGPVVAQTADESLRNEVQAAIDKGVRFLKSKLIDDPEAEQYQPKLVAIGPDHWVAEHDAVAGADALLVN